MKIEQDHITPTTADDGRTYEVVTAEKLYKLPSVTTIINNVMHKPALVDWAYNVGVRETLNHIQSYCAGLDEENMLIRLEALTDGEIKLALQEAKKSHKDEMEEGSRRGIQVHDALEAVINGEEYSYSRKYKPYMDQLKQFIEDYAPEWIETEFKVASIEHGYAGQLDAICIPTKHPPRRKHEPLIGKRVCIDLKSNKDGRVYPETHLPQVEGYGHAYEEMGGEKLDAKLVVGIGPKSYQPCVSYASLNTFLAIKNVYDEIRKMKSNNPNKRK